MKRFVFNSHLNFAKSKDLVLILNLVRSSNPSIINPQKCPSFSEHSYPSLYNFSCNFHSDIDFKLFNNFFQLNYIHFHDNIIGQVFLEFGVFSPVFSYV